MTSGAGRNPATSSPLRSVLSSIVSVHINITCQDNDLAEILPCRTPRFSSMFIFINGTRSGRSVIMTLALDNKVIDSILSVIKLM